MTYNPSTCPGPGDAITWPQSTTAPNDPRNEPDDRAWDELDSAEKRARLAELTHDELLTEALRACDDAAMWERELNQLAKWCVELVDRLRGEKA